VGTDNTTGAVTGDSEDGRGTGRVDGVVETGCIGCGDVFVGGVTADMIGAVVFLDVVGGVTAEVLGAVVCWDVVGGVTAEVLGAVVFLDVVGGVVADVLGAVVAGIETGLVVVRGVGRKLGVGDDRTGGDGISGGKAGVDAEGAAVVAVVVVVVSGRTGCSGDDDDESPPQYPEAQTPATAAPARINNTATAIPMAIQCFLVVGDEVAFCSPSRNSDGKSMLLSPLTIGESSPARDGCCCCCRRRDSKSRFPRSNSKFLSCSARLSRSKRRTSAWGILESVTSMALAKGTKLIRVPDQLRFWSWNWGGLVGTAAALSVGGSWCGDDDILLY
jgi:hypothetical protein